jgi:hypothetical protein
MVALVVSIFNKFYSKIYLYFFNKFYNLDKNKYVLFTHSSTADTFAIASLIDNFCNVHGEIVLIISDSQIDTFRIFVKTDRVKYIILSEKMCKNLRLIIFWDASYQKSILQKGVLKPLHVVLYKNLLELINSRSLFYREALNWIMCLDKEIRFKFPEYNEYDINKANDILNNINVIHKKILLINPICYTHISLSNDVWEDIANAFTKKGYTVVFNLMKNSNDNNNYDISNTFHKVFLPAYLIPLISEKIAFTCARWGGGFDLAHSFNQNSKCIIINFEDSLHTDLYRQKDPSIDYIDDIFLNFCNKKIFKIITLNEMKYNKYLDDQINSIKNV